MTIGERIQARLDAVDMTQSELGRRIGVSQGTIAHLISGRSLGSKHLHAMARELQTTAAYLNMETDDPKEGALPAPSPESVAELLDAVLIREVDIRLSMGGGAINEDLPIQRMVPVSRNWLRSVTDARPEDVIIGRGRGDSMVPTILDGDLVFINTGERRLEDQDRIWAMVYGDLGMIKRVRGLPNDQLQINSDNKAVDPIFATPDEVHTIGRVFAILRKV